MLLSRIIARRRVEGGSRPSFLEAWVPVFLDIAIAFGLVLMSWQPLRGLMNGAGLHVILQGVIVFFVMFVPFQIIAITSSMWATRSRWQDPTED